MTTNTTKNSVDNWLYLAELERDTEPGGTPAGWYPIRCVDSDGVRTVTTDTGARRQTAGTYSGCACFARTTNIPNRGPAWMRLIFRGVAYGAESDEARRILKEAES
jgi:hypothetical protein